MINCSYVSNIKQISNWDFCDKDDSPGDCSESKVGKYLDLSLKIKSKGSPKEVDEDDRKKKICNSKDDDDDDDDDDKDEDEDDDDDDDCPIIYDVGGDSEMLLNKGVGQANLDINVFQEIKTTHLG